MKNDKAKRLEKVARLYYEQGQSQAEIAQQLQVSRPLISRMLREARAYGIVEIHIHPQGNETQDVLSKAKTRFGLKGGRLVPEEDSNLLDNQIGEATLSLVEELEGGRIGLGWGHIFGTLVSILEKNPKNQSLITDVCPLVGNSGASIRHYYTNENVRMFAQQTSSQGHYLYTPALAETKQDLDLLLETEQYQAMLREWKKLDTALVNIGVHPSTPDFATSARFGNLLTQRKAVGRMIAYYFDENGEIIHSGQDYSIQIPLDVLVQCRNVVGICPANVTPKALKGALETRMFTHIVTSEVLLESVVE